MGVKRLRITAVKFRRKIYVAGPRHANAIELAFSGMSDHQRGRVYERIVEGKESIVFGYAYASGRGWEDAELQSARMIMYGFG